ncbi:LuxR C-terminal-related transcriptional regulator [Nonomuraea sediminis]|uniref:LuxR C-terminal-related transcriptional regulator n=1 Tax=Nonomuraea sediminis TaxID=2835864 RepID=UPI001BDCAA56|nr:LuxR C-terminal-related transcriptional regulator [Nonomuraea sediminis]
MADAPRHNLPAEPNRFVGRERDLDDLAGLFDETRLVTLCGVGGIGKTRLARRLAARLVSDFADGVWLVELARITRPELVVQALADVLGVREEIGHPLSETLLARLERARMLLVLDNCEHLVERCAELAAELIARCPDLRLLLTSREPLRVPGELIWRVPPLDLPVPGNPEAESVRLFEDRASVLPPGSAVDIARLCTALDGLPLAIELAAARTRMLTPAQIADRIGDRFRLLTSGDRTAPARQRTLLAAVDWSHDLLEPKERVLLRRLSVFAGPFDLELAEEICADGRLIEAEEVLDLLGSLVDKSLVLSARGRFRLLETIRQYAGRRLREEGEQEGFRDRHLRVFCDLQVRLYDTGLVAADTPWPERLACYTRGRALLDDQRAALGWAVESRNAPLGIRLCLIGSSVLEVHGDMGESVEWYERLLALDLSPVPPRDVALARAHLAFGLENRDELGRARDLVLDSVAELRGEPYAFEVGIAYLVAANALLRTGKVEEAVHYIEELHAKADEHGDIFNVALAMLALSSVAMKRGRLREAQRQAETALAVAQRHGHRWAIARISQHLGGIAEQRGDLQSAQEHFAAAIPMLEELDNRVELAACLARLGRVAALLHDLPLARERLRASMALSLETSHRLGISRCLAALSAVAEAGGDLEGAVLTASAATALRETMGQYSSKTVRVDELLATARAKVGEGHTNLLWTRGRQLSPEEAAEFALGQGRTISPAAERVERIPRSVLTSREQEIAGLLTRGLSNRAIAEELVISPATVARHIANIMEKLGFTARAQIAVWAAEHEHKSA